MHPRCGSAEATGFGSSDEGSRQMDIHFNFDIRNHSPKQSQFSDINGDGIDPRSRYASPRAGADCSAIDLFGIL
jgi:hypothetical protein